MSATGVNVLLYRSKTLANGEHPLMLCVTKERRRKYVSMGISLAARYWDFDKSRPKRNCPNRIYIGKNVCFFVFSALGLTGELLPALAAVG